MTLQLDTLNSVSSYKFIQNDGSPEEIDSDIGDVQIIGSEDRQ